jgi:hypothetical protein
MYRLRSVDVMSCAKIMGAVYGSLGLIVLPFLVLGSLGSLMFGRGSDAMSGFAMFVIAILVPVFYGALGFVMGALSAWIYNLFAGWLGGVRLELKAEGRDLSDHWTFPEKESGR